jgi:membrane associated rhomboid family serine protease
MSTSPPPPSPSSRIEELIRTTPPVTLGVVGVCSFLYIFVQVLLDVPLYRLTLAPDRAWGHGQMQRIISGALFHHDVLHLAMNMISTLAIGSLLERQMGSLRLLSTILLAIVITGALYMTVVLILVFVFGLESWMRQNVIGFSGVLFYLSVLECNLGTALPRRSVFGMVEVPSYVYPWVL